MQINLPGAEQIADLEINQAGQAKELLDASNDLHIQTDDQAGIVVDYLAKLKACYKDMEDQRGALGRPVLDFTKSLNNRFKALTGPLDERIKLLGKNLAGYDQHKKKMAEEAVRKAEDDKRKWEQEQESARQAAEKANKPAPKPKAPPPPPPPVTNTPVFGKSTGARSTTVSRWVHRVSDITEVPLRYLQVNDAAVKAAIKSGARGNNIPGIEIFDDPYTR